MELEGEFADEDFGSDMGEFRTTTADDDEDDGNLIVTHDSMNQELYERCWGEDALEGCDCDDED